MPSISTACTHLAGFFTSLVSTRKDTYCIGLKDKHVTLVHTYLPHQRHWYTAITRQHQGTQRSTSLTSPQPPQSIMSKRERQQPLSPARSRKRRQSAASSEISSSIQLSSSGDPGPGAVPSTSAESSSMSSVEYGVPDSESNMSTPRSEDSSLSEHQPKRTPQLSPSTLSLQKDQPPISICANALKTGLAIPSTVRESSHEGRIVRPLI